MSHPAIQTRQDRIRGCGKRKPGGMYLVAAGLGRPCGKLPIPLECCPTCSNGIKPTRGWTWVNGTVLAAQNECRTGAECSACPLGGPIGRVGLLWIGGKFYKRPEDWTREAHEQGISRRLAQIPKEFEVGKTWVFVAHRQCIENADGSYTAGVFHAFRPTAIEYVVRGDETDEEIERLVKRGITPVRVELQGEPAANGVALRRQDEPDDLDDFDASDEVSHTDLF
jgi:hypothetical protein